MKKELIKSLKKYKWQILIEIILIIISVIFIAYPSKIVGRMIDLLYNAESNKSEIIKSIVQLLSVSIGVLITRVLWKNLDFRLNVYIDKDLRDRLFTKLLKTKVKALNKIKNGEIMSYFFSDLRKVTMTTAKFISTGTRIIANFTIAIIMMSNSANIKLTLVSLIPIFMTIVVIILIRNRMDKSFKLAQKSFTELSEYVQESTDSIRTMKAFCGEEKQINEFEFKNATLKKNNINVFEEHKKILKSQKTIEKMINKTELNIENEEDLQDFLRILNVIIRAISMEVVLKKLTVEEGKQRIIREIEILKKGMKKL